MEEPTRVDVAEVVKVEFDADNKLCVSIADGPGAKVACDPPSVGEREGEARLASLAPGLLAIPPILPNSLIPSLPALLLVGLTVCPIETIEAFPPTNELGVLGRGPA